MLRVDGAYLYELGARMRAILTLPEQDTKLLAISHIVVPANDALKTFLEASVFTPHIRTVRGYAQRLSDTLDTLMIDFSDSGSFDEPVPRWTITRLKDEFRTFDATLLAELQNSPLYLVFSKGGFDVVCLTDAGLTLFPSTLEQKVPEACEDAIAAAKCLAFEVFTAAGFHLHRANEAVLRRYFDEVAGPEKRPKSRNMGDYLKRMKDLQVGDPKVLDVLQSIKDLHRNPLMHPEDKIADADEALNLYSAVRACIGYMLGRIPGVPART